MPWPKLQNINYDRSPEQARTHICTTNFGAWRITLAKFAFILKTNSKATGNLGQKPEARSQKTETRSREHDDSASDLRRNQRHVTNRPWTNLQSTDTPHRPQPTHEPPRSHPAIRTTHRKTIALNQNWFRGPDFNYFSYIRGKLVVRKDSGDRGSAFGIA